VDFDGPRAAKMMLDKRNMFDMDDVENVSEGRNRYGLNK